VSEVLSSMFEHIDKMLVGCNIDYDALSCSQIDVHFFDTYENTRIVNSFLFNFGKLQDKIGAKLFKQVLYELKEIDTFEQPMLDVLHMLEKMKIIDSVSQWEKLREIRNILADEYPFEIEERVENIALAMEGFISLKEVYVALKKSVL